MLQTDSWVETEGGCSGPKNVRNQPSRESQGVLMTEQLSNKYANEFDLPFQNLSRYIKQINNNWDRLTPEQKNMIVKQFVDMDIKSSKESFENAYGIKDVMDYVKTNPKENVPQILDMMWKPKGEISLEQARIKESFDKWISDQSYKMYCNWKNMLITFFTIMLFVLFGALIGYSMK